MGGALAFIPPPLVYPISVISGIGPLWFAQMLFAYSCLLVLLRRLGWAEKWRKRCENLPSAVFVLLFLPLWGAAQVLNLPVLTMYRFGIYLAAFLIGYLVLSLRLRPAEPLTRYAGWERTTQTPRACGAV